MTDYVILLIGDDARWFEESTPEELEATFALHGQFAQALTEHGHQILGGEALMSSKQAKTVRPGGGDVTDGPFTETAEQVGGFYQVRSDNLDDLLQHCQILARSGDAVEVREVMPTGEPG